jgi:predicted membrane protein
MRSFAAWRRLWWWWLLLVALSWAGLEAASLVLAHVTGQQHIVDWTLSDTIRRWSSAEAWLAPLVVGTACGLLWHFFGQRNPGQRNPGQRND